MQHHVQRRGAAGAGETVTVEGEQAGTHYYPRESLLHRRQALPVHTAIETIEQSGASQGPAAGAHRTESAGLAGLALQPGYVFTGNGALNADATANDDHVHRRGFVHGSVRGDLQAVTGPDLAAIDGEGGPAIQLATGQLVGHAQRFYSGRQRNQREIVQQQKADGLRRTVLGLSPGVERRHRGISSHKAGDWPQAKALFILPSKSWWGCSYSTCKGHTQLPMFERIQKRHHPMSLR
ncbi:hypothetical protein D3C73_511910 [compost metagenome]